MKKGLVLCAVALILAGCATSLQYGNMLNTWVGNSEENLVKTWGIPSRTYMMADGQKMIEYNNSQDTVNYQTPATYKSGGLFNLHTKKNKSPKVCKTTFLINDGVVTSWKFFGQGCVSHYQANQQPIKFGLVP